MYQFTTQLPGVSDLTIKVMDYNVILRNEIIGSTTIDLEERYF